MSKQILRKEVSRKIHGNEETIVNHHFIKSDFITSKEIETLVDKYDDYEEAYNVGLGIDINDDLIWIDLSLAIGLIIILLVFIGIILFTDIFTYNSSTLENTSDLFYVDATPSTMLTITPNQSCGLIENTDNKYDCKLNLKKASELDDKYGLGSSIFFNSIEPAKAVIKISYNNSYYALPINVVLKRNNCIEYICEDEYMCYYCYGD